jgi:hypothetical protein
MAIVEGPFQNVTQLFGINDLLITLVPEDFVATTTVQMTQGLLGDQYYVDWGDGTPIAYNIGTNASAVPTGNILVTADETVKRFRLTTNTITSVDILGGSQLTNLASAFSSKSKITSFTCDTLENITAIGGAWANCTGLTSFPNVILGSAMTSLSSAWSGCTGLTSFPALDFRGSSASMFSCWNGCSGLTSFGAITGTQNVGTWQWTWRNCTSLTSFPLIDMSGNNAGAGGETWGGCSSLTTLPAIDCGSGTAEKICADCTSMTSCNLDLSANSTLKLAFDGCTALTNPGGLTWAATDFTGMFSGCTGLTSIGDIVTTGSNVVYSNMFGNCSNLTFIEGLDTTNVLAGGAIFDGCTSLTDNPNATEQNLLENAGGHDYHHTDV